MRRIIFVLVVACCPGVSIFGQLIECLSITCPKNLVIECSAPEGTPVFFQAEAANRCGKFLELTYKPRPGSLFQPGTTTVTATASDGRIKKSCSFTVTVRDTTAPTILAPRGMRVPCEGSKGTRVEFSVAARDNCDPEVTVVCDPPSGFLFPKGTNVVRCTARDLAGNSRTVSFPIVVEGECTAQAECLVLQCPEDIMLTAPDRTGLKVTYRAEVEGNCSRREPLVTYDPPSGSVFPPGESIVWVTAKDGIFTRKCSFKVILRDEDPPVLNVPSAIVVDAQGLDGAVVNFSVTAADKISTAVAVHAFPPSGSIFPVGRSGVVVEAVDEAGNRAVSGFSVTVRPPPPVQISQSERNEFQVKWDYVGKLEVSETLSPADWKPWTGTVSSNGFARMAALPPTASQLYFRVVRSAIAAPPDSDKDGVPDVRDRCPDTLPGLRVDKNGCSPVQIARSPEAIIEKVEVDLHDALRFLEQGEEAENIRVSLAREALPLADSSGLMREGSITSATIALSNTVTSLKAVRDQLAAKVINFERREPRDPNHGDTDEEDFRKENQQIALQKVSELVESAESARQSFEFTRTAVRQIGVIEGRTTEVEDGGTKFTMDGGLHVEVASNYQDLIADGREGVSGSGITFDDGTALMTKSDAPQMVPSSENFTFDPIHFKIAPWQVFGPSGPWILHDPEGYRHENASSVGHYFLELGMRFGATGMKNHPTSVYKYGLRLDLRYTTTNWTVREITLAPFLEVGDVPVNLPKDMHFALSTLTVTKIKVPKLESGQPGTPEVIETESYTLVVKPRYTYAKANYMSTIFNLEDSPEETRTGASQVTSLDYDYPLMHFTNRVFQAEAYLALGPAGTSYPQAFPITTFIPFAILDQDFYVHELAPLSELLTGTDKPSGLRWPRLTGFNNGRPYSYAVGVPAVVRDLISGCSDTLDCNNDGDTYYRLPFAGGWPVWSMSQGNCGTFTHKGNSRFAYDMPAPQNTEVRAARGGVVNFVRESGSQNCCPDGDCVDDCEFDANVVRITHSDGTIGRYVHMPQNGVYVTVGTRVRRGDPIAKVGNTGFSTGPHLHFEVRSGEDGPSVPVRFQTLVPVAAPGFHFPSDTVRNCVQPESGDILFSNNKGWFE